MKTIPLPFYELRIFDKIHHPTLVSPGRTTCYACARHDYTLLTMVADIITGERLDPQFLYEDLPTVTERHFAIVKWQPVIKQNTEDEFYYHPKTVFKAFYSPVYPLPPTAVI